MSEGKKKFKLPWQSKTCILQKQLNCNPSHIKTKEDEIKHENSN